MQRFLFVSAEIGTLNCNSTNFQEKSWNEGVSFVETLDQSTKGFFMFGVDESFKLYVYLLLLSRLVYKLHLKSDHIIIQLA